MTRPFLLHLLFMALRYALAVLSATLVVCVLMGLPTIFPDQGAWGSFYRYLTDFPMMFGFGLMMTAMYGLPGWLISVLAAEFRTERRWFWFAIAGFLTALLAQVLSGGANFTIFADIFFVTVILIGGFFGGLAYWAAAGRGSGRWREPQETRAAEAAVDEWALK